jgi:hypothetical protein
MPLISLFECCTFFKSKEKSKTKSPKLTIIYTVIPELPSDLLMVLVMMMLSTEDLSLGKNC